MRRTFAALAALALLAPAQLGCSKVIPSAEAAPAEPVAIEPVVTPPPPAPVDDGTKHFKVELHGPLEKALGDQAPAGIAAPLALVTSRLTLWWLEPKDARAGDTIEAVYELPAGKEPLVRHVRYTSLKLGKTFEATYFQAPGAAFGRYFTPDGQELEQRLVDSPIQSYEQITSLLKDGRRHKGVDFKAPSGTPITAPFDGHITKRNWNWKSNGNCLEFVSGDGSKHALFLHLSPIPENVKEGMNVKKGQQLATSGNTGHTTAPHLHYQLEGPNKAVLDPFKVHALTRGKVDGTQVAALDAERAKWSAKLSK